MKLLSAVLLFVASVAANAQELDPLGSGLPASHTLSSLPKNLIAIQPQLVDGGVGSLLSMSYSMVAGTATSSTPSPINVNLLRDMGQTVWVDRDELKSGAAEMIKAYKLSLSLFESLQSSTAETLVFRLQYIRRDSMVAFTVRPDLSPEALVTAITAPAPKVLSPARQASKKTMALSNVKQVCTGMFILLSDYDDVIPYGQSTAQMFELVMPYLKNNELIKSLNPNGGRLLFNMSLAGANIVDVENPAETPMVFDEQPWPDGMRLVGYADSHAKFVNQAEWDRISKNLKLKLKKNGKPLKPGQSPPVIK